MVAVVLLLLTCALAQHVAKVPKSTRLDKCCPQGETLGTNDRRPCIPSSHRLLHPFRPPPIYKRPGTLAVNASYTLHFGYLPRCRLLYYLEPEREPAEVFWLLDSGTVLRAGEGPLSKGSYCLEAIPQLDAVLPVLCFPEGEVEGVGVFAVYPVGMLVSIPFLASTILIYTMINELQRRLHGRCLVCHVACLLFGYLSLAAIQIDTTAFPYYMCVVMGYAIQFFFMATFFWLNVMCFDIYWAFSGLRNLTGSVKERERKKLILYSIYAWGFPLLILLVTLGIDYSPAVPNDSKWKPRVGVEKCFFKDETATGIYFYFPMGMIIAINIILFSITAYRIRTLQNETRVLNREDSRRHASTNDKESVSDQDTLVENTTTANTSPGSTENEPYLVKNIRFSLYLKLFVVMGINWVMELVSFLLGGLPNYIWYVPDFTNTLQGVFIFIIFVWKKRVRRLIWAKLQSCCGRKAISNGSKSPWTDSTRHTSSSGMSQSNIKMQPVPSQPTSPPLPTSPTSK